MIDFIPMETDVSAVGSHIEKWLARESEMKPVLAFAGAGKHRALLWGALLNEWLEATFELSDVGVAQVKLAWWGDALAKASVESPHPLIRAFAQETGGAVPASLWNEVAHAALELTLLDVSAGDVAGLLASRLPLARALVAVEAALWPQAGEGDANAVACSLVLFQWRGHRHGRTPQPGWLPLQLLARHGLRAQALYQGSDTPASRQFFADLATALLAGTRPLAGSRLRRIRSRFDALALVRVQKGLANPFRASGFGVVLQGWRAARGVPA